MPPIYVSVFGWADGGFVVHPHYISLTVLLFLCIYARNRGSCAVFTAWRRALGTVMGLFCGNFIYEAIVIMSCFPIVHRKQ